MINDVFADFLNQVKPIKFREPLAASLGAFKSPHGVLEYTFTDAVKMAGHACPTVSGAYLCCQKALEKLYSEDIPVRGEIAVTVYGEPDEGVYGVMGQVLGFLTGAAPSTGFHGLGHKFRRKDLLKYDARKPDPEALCFEFCRLDTGKSVLAKYYPHQVPFSHQKAERMSDLLTRVLWEGADEQEVQEFQQLWMGKVKDMLIEKKNIDHWLKLEER